MKYIVTVNGKKYEVIIEQGSGNEGMATIGVNQSAAAVTPAENIPAVNTRGAAGEEPVLAPMPGTILKIKIKEGQTVKKGEVLFILEAMKMENEIMAARDAVVSKITISSGTSVKTGDCLALLK